MLNPDKKTLEFFTPETQNPVALPHISQGVSAGFPSPAMDFMENRLDINKLLVKNPQTTFYVRVSGNSMIGAGIADNDILTVDRSLEPENNAVAVCFIDGEFTVKRLKVTPEGLFLQPENENYPAISVTEDNRFFVWGIVTHVIHKI